MSAASCQGLRLCGTCATRRLQHRRRALNPSRGFPPVGTTKFRITPYLVAGTQKHLSEGMMRDV
ncbi:unnamed protein product [Amoebophrya sp. A120]|nr:unnamed protein product [Amoebophrya sp. A120]|eukprot:GSA120T00023868001.1